MHTAATKPFLVVSSAVELATGLGLLAVPTLIVSILLGEALHAPASLVVARVTGAALLALGLVCWAASNENVGNRAVRGIVAAMFLYDALAFGLLVYSRLGLGQAGIGLWPAAGLHLVLAAWCVSIPLTRRLR